MPLASDLIRVGIGLEFYRYRLGNQQCDQGRRRDWNLATETSFPDDNVRVQRQFRWTGRDDDEIRPRSDFKEIACLTRLTHSLYNETESRVFCQLKL